MEHKTIRDIERQANLQAGVEKEDENLTQKITQSAEVSEELTYSSIAHTLANRYDSIYYVNIKTNRYVEYISSSEYRDLKVETSGEDFFADSARNIRRVVHPDDQSFALMVHQKEYILAELEKDSLLSVTYRIMFDGQPYYYNGRMTMAGEGDRDHLIIGWANVNSQILREREFEAAQNEKKLVQNINKALISDYVKVFYVDLEDNSYIEFTPDEVSEELTATRTGEDFFADTQIHADERIYRKDLEGFKAAFHKTYLMALMIEAPFVMRYRLMQNKKPVWHMLKALYADNKTHMLIAVRNIDVQKRREAEYENKMHRMSILVNRDTLTSVKSKNAFSQEESKWNHALMDNEEDVRFAIVICDINDLKIVNDTMGHKAGDELIIEAASLISDLFKRSPVFRIGGDEFAVVLSDQDYSNRSRLMGELEEHVRSNMKQGGVVVASGMASYDRDNDSSFTDVFKRADQNMYENKRTLKKVTSSYA